VGERERRQACQLRRRRGEKGREVKKREVIKLWSSVGRSYTERRDEYEIAQGAKQKVADPKVRYTHKPQREEA